MLRVELTKQMGTFDLQMQIAVKPAFTALFGHSGAGKTTTLNLITGLLRPDRGEIVLNDRILFSSKKKIHLAPQQRNIGYIFQESRLFPHLRVRENLEFGFKRVPRQQRRFDFDDIVRITGVQGLLARMPAGLSGGEKQRVALARALLASPEMLLLDEPLAALDLNTRLTFLTFLKSVHQELRLPVLYVSHDLANVLHFVDEVIVLHQGRNVAAGPPFALLDRLSAAPLVLREEIPNIFIAEVVKTDESAGLTVTQAGPLIFTLPPLECKAGSRLQLNIPASEIILATEEPRNLSASNIFAGEVSRIYRIGERVLVVVDAGLAFTVEIVPATVSRLGLEPGRRVYLIIKASSFRRLE